MAMPYVLDYSDASDGPDWVTKKSGSFAAIRGGLYASRADADFALVEEWSPHAYASSWKEGLRSELARISDAVSSESWEFEPPNKQSIELAEDVLEEFALRGVRPRHVAPSPEGGVSYLLLKGKKRGAVELYNDGEHVLMLSDGNGIPFAWSFSGAGASQ